MKAKASKRPALPHGWITLQEAADLLNTHKARILALVAADKITPCYANVNSRRACGYRLRDVEALVGQPKTWRSKVITK